MPAGETSRGTPSLDRQYDEDHGAALASLNLSIGALTERMGKPADPRIPWDACHPVWQTGQIPLVGNAGTLIQSGLYGPELPYWWDVRAVTLWGFTAGTVTVYRNSTIGENVVQTSTIGQFTWSGQLLLAPQDTLIFGATGVTGQVNVTMQAIEVASAWLPEYLM